MKTKCRLSLSLMLAVLMLGLNLPLPAAAGTPPIPDEVEVDWEVSITSNYAWSSESIDDDGKVYNRYNGNDSFYMQSSGTTKLERAGLTYDGYPYLEPNSDDKDYNLSCQGGGTSNDWYTYTLTKWEPGKGWGETRDFEGTTVTTWQYSLPSERDDIDPEDDAVFWFEIIPPESDNDPVRYRMRFEPFFFIQHDSLGYYIDVSGEYRSTNGDFEGSHSESGELVNPGAQGAVDLADQVWYDRMEHHPSGSLIEGELEFSDNKFRDSGSVQHTFSTDDGQAEITIKYKINQKPGVKAIQPNQVLGRYQYQDEENYQPATDFVAGKDTVIQVFLPDEVKADQVSNLELDIYRNGSQVTTLTGPKKDRKNNALIFVPQDKSVCGNWAAGTYRFVAKLEDSEETLDNVEFEERRDFRILAVPVTANYNGTIKGPGSNWAEADKFLRQVFPLANENVKLEIREQPVDASESRCNLATEEGRKWVWLKLKDLQPPKYMGGRYDAIVGFVADPIPIIQDGQPDLTQGFTVSEPAVIVALDADYQTTLAHEIGHFFGLGDEYSKGAFKMGVNPPPPGYQGSDWDTGESVTSPDSQVQPAKDGLGSRISEKLHPYEVGGRGLLGDLTSFMGSGAPPSKNWTTPVIWQHLFEAFAPQSGAQAFRAFSTSQSGEKFVTVSGLISSAGQVEIMEPCFSYSSGASFTPAEGTHSILALDAGGTVLASQGFTPYFRVWSMPGQVQDQGVFSAELPLPAGTNCLRIVEGDQVLHEIPVSTSAPCVSIINPLPGASLSGTVNLEWTASDADGEALAYKVEYSPDGNRWIVLEPATASTQCTADFSRLPGGEQAAIRVTATDGINSTTAIRAGLQSPVKAPEVYIQAPADGFSAIQGEGVFLEGRAYDPQAGWIYDSAGLVWSSDRDGELGRGSLVFEDKLSRGTHTITLQASGPSGQTKTKSVNLTVASAGTDDPQEFSQQSDVPLDHTWTVTFNDQVDPATLTSANLQVLDANGNPVNIKPEPGADGKTALILPPPGGYLPGQSYVILVKNGIHSASGKALKSAYIKRFTTLSF